MHPTQDKSSQTGVPGDLTPSFYTSVDFESLVQEVQI